MMSDGSFDQSNVTNIDLPNAARTMREEEQSNAFVSDVARHSSGVDDLKIIEAQQKLASLKLEDSNFRRERLETLRNLTIVVMLTTILFSSAAMAVMQNPKTLYFSEETAQVINGFVNAIALLVVPFLTGMLGATTRLLMSGAKPSKEGTIILGSGLMASFSWIGIKSGILAALLAPHLEKNNLASVDLVRAPDNFYTLLLVAVFVGMFSTNLYLMINHRVEQLAKAASKKEEAPSTVENAHSATRR